VIVAPIPLPDPDAAPEISLAVQLICALLLVITMMIVHGGGIVAVTRLLRLRPKDLVAHEVDMRAFGLLTLIAFCLFTIHVLEITIFAIFYRIVGALRDFETALYFSVSAYTTLGQPDLGFPDDWRLVGAFEGLIGFLLIGWSTAVFITDINKLLRPQDQ